MRPTKLTLLFVLLLTLLSYAQAQSNACPVKSQKNYCCGEVDERILERLAGIDYTMETHFQTSVAHTFKRKADYDKALKVANLCEQVLNDPDFWKALEYYDRYQYTFWQSGDHERQISGRQIVNCMLHGTPDDAKPLEELKIYFDVKLYALGFKTPIEKAVAKEVGDGKIYNKKWFFRKESIASIGSNWMHEFAHSKGIKHCFYCSEARDYSIPYVINRIFSEVAQKYIMTE